MTTASRARFGTTSPKTHNAGAPVAQVRALYAQVVAVSGNVVTLDRPAQASVSTAPVWTGVTDVTVEDLEIDGNRPSPTVRPASPLSYTLANDVLVRDCVIRDAHHGGVHLQAGTNNSTIEGCTFMDIGSLKSASGADIWIFQSAHHNTVRNNAFLNSDPSVGSSDNGIWLDDRTTGSNEWDGDVHHNVIEANRFELNDGGLPPLTAIGVSGGTYNTIRGNSVNVGLRTSSTYGIRILSDYGQSSAPVISAYNTVSGNQMTMLVRAVWLQRANANAVSGNTMWWAYTKCVNEGTGNVFANNLTDDGTC